MPKHKPDVSEFEALCKTVSKCKLGSTLDELEAEDQVKCLAALEMAFTNPVIAKWLKTKGHRVSEDVVRRHRTGRCCCDRPE